MMRKLFCLLMMLLLPAASVAEITVETISESGGKLATNRYTFADEVPQVVTDQLAMHGYLDMRCVSGLALERLVLETPEGQENAYRSSDALLVVEQNGGYSLIGLRWHFADQKGWLSDFGSLGLSLENGFQLAFGAGELHTVDFMLTAECAGTVRIWRLAVTGENVWYIEECMTPGGETVTWSEHEGAFVLPDGRYYACWWPQLEGMESLDAFPVTAEAAAALAKNSWNGLPLDRLAIIGGNLREEPTGKSRSLGLAQGHVLAEVLDERPGVYDPWYQVRVGNTVGWVSGSYVTLMKSELLAGTEYSDGLLRPLKQAIVRGSIPLRTSLDDPAPVMTLAEGTVLQVLSVTKDGWLHVVVPTARAMRCMDMNGTYGYVHLDEVDVQNLNIPE